MPRSSLGTAIITGFISSSLTLTPGSSSALLRHRPLRTVRETFTSYGSSPAEVSVRETDVTGESLRPVIFASPLHCLILVAGTQSHLYFR
jgi:hypothetical protein